MEPADKQTARADRCVGGYGKWCVCVEGDVNVRVSFSSPSSPCY